MAKKRAKEGVSSRASNAVEAVCVSPTTGRLFTTAVDLGKEIPMDEDDLTSENNSAIRAEVRREYERIEKEMDKNSGQAFEKKKVSRSGKERRSRSEHSMSRSKFDPQQMASRHHKEYTNTIDISKPGSRDVINPSTSGINTLPSHIRGTDCSDHAN